MADRQLQHISQFRLGDFELNPQRQTLQARQILSSSARQHRSAFSAVQSSDRCGQATFAAHPAFTVPPQSSHSQQRNAPRAGLMASITASAAQGLQQRRAANALLEPFTQQAASTGRAHGVAQWLPAPMAWVAGAVAQTLQQRQSGAQTEQAALQRRAGDRKRRRPGSQPLQQPADLTELEDTWQVTPQGAAQAAAARPGRTAATFAHITVGAPMRKQRRHTRRLREAPVACYQHRHRQHMRHLQAGLVAIIELAEASLQQEAGEAVQTAASVGKTAKDDLQQWALRLPVGVRRLLAGGLAGAISKTVTAPVETLRMQVMSGKNGNMRQCFARTWKRGGILGFFSGNSADIIRVIPSKAVELAAFDIFKGLLATTNEETGKVSRPGALLTGLAGAAAGATSTVGLYPLETIRTHLAEGEYRGIVDAARGIIRQEGFGGLYGGMAASLIGVLPYAALRLGLYDGFKLVYRRTTGEEAVPTGHSMAFGAVAGLLAATATFPVETVRRRLMSGAARGPTFTVMQQIVEKEGWRALYAGLGLTWLKQVPQNAVSFACFDLLKSFFGASTL